MTESRAALIALASLRAMTPRRLHIMLARHSAIETLHRLRSGIAFDAEVEPAELREMFGALREQAKIVDADQVVARCDSVGVSIITREDRVYPRLLVHDPFPPAVLFVRGCVDPLALRSVSIVGTRNATAAGRATAFELGEALSSAGLAIVSGLARGIDGAAHRGVRAAGGHAIGVVGNGVDAPYPKQNADIWQWVGDNGLLMSEWPPGTPPGDFHFPLRNRVIAALGDVLVVVESRESGGSLITAKAAAERGVTVMAVPGSIRHPAAGGTNKLISEGAIPVTCVDDVFVALGLDHSRDAGRSTIDRPIDAVSADVLELCIAAPRTIDVIVGALGIPVPDAAVALSRLEQLGLVVATGGWFESTQSRLSGSKVAQS
jgi:DNA processing protein